MLTPAALSILVAMFAEGRERNIALGAWGAVGGVGAAAGVLFGGILVEFLSWEWIFFVNVPVGVAALILDAVPALREPRQARPGLRRDPARSSSPRRSRSSSSASRRATAGAGALAETIGVFVASAMLLLAFVGWERRVKDPLVPVLDLPAADADGGEHRRLHPRDGAVRDVPDADAVHAAGARTLARSRPVVGYLAVAGTAIIWANVAAAAVTRVGVKPALVFGMSMMTVGLLYFTQVSRGRLVLADLFPGFLIVGLGMPFAFVPITIAAVAGTKPQEAGLASGLINTSQQIGGAVGIAILSTIAVSTTTRRGRVRERRLRSR